MDRAYNLFEWAIGFAHPVQSLVCNLKTCLIDWRDSSQIKPGQSFGVESEGWFVLHQFLWWLLWWQSHSSAKGEKAAEEVEAITFGKAQGPDCRKWQTPQLWVVPVVSNDLSASAACVQMLGTKASVGKHLERAWLSILKHVQTIVLHFRSISCPREPSESGAKSLRWWWWLSCFSPSAGVPSRSSCSFSLSIQTTRPTTPHTRSKRGPTACPTPTPLSTLLFMDSWVPPSKSPSGKPSRFSSNTK